MSQVLCVEASDKPYEKIQSLGGGHKTEQWTTIHGFLCRNRGVSFFVSNVLNL
jgi:hypothetical protein